MNLSGTFHHFLVGDFLALAGRFRVVVFFSFRSHDEIFFGVLENRNRKSMESEENFVVKSST
jgi:hypothetical protein